MCGSGRGWAPLGARWLPVYRDSASFWPYQFSSGLAERGCSDGPARGRVALTPCPAPLTKGVMPHRENGPWHPCTREGAACRCAPESSRTVMKTHPIYHRNLLICALLLGTVGALRSDPMLPHAPGARIEKPAGLFSGLFGRRAERIVVADQDDDDDDDYDEDDDDDQRFRPRGRQPQFPPPAPGTTIITTTRTTNQVPVPSDYPGANRSSRAQEGVRSIAPPTLRPLSFPRDVQPSSPPPVPLDQRYPLVHEQVRTAVVPAPTVVAPARIVVPSRTVIVPSTEPAPPASRQFPVTPPRSTILVPSDVRIDTRSSQQPYQTAPSAPVPTFLPVDPASLSAPVVPPGHAIPPPSLSSFADRVPVPAPPSQGPPSVNPPSAEQPTPPSEPLFGTPVPGRRGLVYPPGQEAIPENMIDVNGITPGTKVRDPVSKVVFRVP